MLELLLRGGVLGTRYQDLLEAGQRLRLLAEVIGEQAAFLEEQIGPAGCVGVGQRDLQVEQAQNQVDVAAFVVKPARFGERSNIEGIPGAVAGGDNFL